MSGAPPDADMTLPPSQQSLEYLTQPPADRPAEFNQPIAPGAVSVPYYNPPHIPPVNFASQPPQPDQSGPTSIEEDADLWGDDVSPEAPYNAFLPYESESQISESLPVFAATLSTLAAFLTEPMVMHRIRDLARQPKAFDNTILPIFNNLRSLVNQWNNTVDDELSIQRSVTAPSPRNASAAAAPPTTSLSQHTSQTVHPAHALGTTQRPFRVGGVPTHHTVQTTLPFASTHRPPPIPTANRPAPSYAQVAKSRPANTLFNITSALASAMPDAPAEALLTMATKLVPAPPSNRAVPRHAPRNASKVITVKPSSGTVNVSEIPNDQQLLSTFSIVYEEAKMTGQLPQDAPGVLFVRWINNALQLQFRSSPCEGTEAVVESFWRACVGLSRATPICSKFRFRNDILYRRIPFPDLAKVSSDESVQQIKNALLSQYAWEEVTMIGNPRIQITEGSSYGTVFADFYDSLTSRYMRQIMRQVVYLNGATCRAIQAHNFRPATPCCAICQRWGHLADICRSQVVRCPICAQPHDERNHEHLAPLAPTKCFNCGEPHRADSADCSFFQHRRDREWIQNHQPAMQTARRVPHIDSRQVPQTRRTTRIGMGRQGPSLGRMI